MWKYAHMALITITQLYLTFVTFLTYYQFIYIMNNVISSLFKCYRCTYITYWMFLNKTGFGYTFSILVIPLVSSNLSYVLSLMTRSFIPSFCYIILSAISMKWNFFSLLNMWKYAHLALITITQLYLTFVTFLTYYQFIYIINKVISSLFKCYRRG
jgi:hypothetical protein